MSGLIRTETAGRTPRRPACAGWVVNGRRYTHSAARFWPTLLDEVAEGFPDGTFLELTADGAGDLGIRHLFPEVAFREDLERLLEGDTARELHETILTLELTGPPPPVRYRILDAERRCLAEGELPPDVVDAEIFMVLVAWPLKWGGLEVAAWNDASVAGCFRGEDPRRGRRYEISFTLTTTPLSEGLLRRTFGCAFSLEEGL